MPQYCLHLWARHDHRNAPLGHRPCQVIHPGQLNAEDLLVQKQQCAQGLTMGSHRDLALHRQIGQVGLNLHLTHLTRMPLAMKIDEILDPVNIRFLSAQAIVQVTDLLPQLIQQPR